MSRQTRSASKNFQNVPHLHGIARQGKPQGFKGHQKNSSSVTWVSGGYGSEEGLRRKGKEMEMGDDDIFLVQGIMVTKDVEIMGMREGSIMMERRSSVGKGTKGMEDFV